MLQEHGDLDSRIAQLIKIDNSVDTFPAVAAAAASVVTAPAAPTKPNKQNLRTQPYNEEEGEAVMDDEELHSLLGV